MFPFSRYAFLPCLAPLTDRFPFPTPWTPRADLGEREIYPRQRPRNWIQSTTIGAGSIYMQKRNTPSSINGSTIHFVRNTDKQELEEMVFFSPSNHADDNKRQDHFSWSLLLKFLIYLTIKIFFLAFSDKKYLSVCRFVLHSSVLHLRNIV